MDDTAIKVPVPATTGKVNPILKRDPHQQPSSLPSADDAAQGNDADGKLSSPGSKEKRHIVWDEHAIEEHDLLRGTRMKIDEPNTPYTHYDHSDEESNSSGRHPRSPDENQTEHAAPNLATNWNDISSKLQAVADKRDSAPLSPARSRDSNMSDSEDETRKKKDKFKDLRKKHYNEAEAMRRWKAEHANDGDDDEDDDDDDMEE